MINAAHPDILSYRRQSETITALKNRMDIVSTEAVTGRRADQTLAADGLIGDVHLLQKSLNDLDQAGRIQALVNTRLDLATLGVSGSRAALNDIDIRATIALEGGASGLEIIKEEAAANLSSVFTALNANHAGRYLFSGDAVGTPPFGDPQNLLDDVKSIMEAHTDPAALDAALDDYFDNPAGEFRSNIYKGSQTSPEAISLGNGQTINIGMRADDESFRDTIRGLAVMATAESFAGNDFDTVFKQGIGEVSNGKTLLIEAEGWLGIQAETMAKAEERRSTERASLTNVFNAIVGRDQFEAAGELKTLEVQIQSAFVLTARLSELSLTNYLR